MSALILEARFVHVDKAEKPPQRVFILAKKQITSTSSWQTPESKGTDFRVMKPKVMAFQPGRSIRPGNVNSVTQGYKLIKDREYVHP